MRFVSPNPIATVIATTLGRAFEISAEPGVEFEAPAEIAGELAKHGAAPVPETPPELEPQA